MSRQLPADISNRLDEIFEAYRMAATAYELLYEPIQKELASTTVPLQSIIRLDEAVSTAILVDILAALFGPDKLETFNVDSVVEPLMDMVIKRMGETE